jgi:hypothetical protein
LQEGSLQYVNIYATVVSQTSSSFTLQFDPSGGFFSGSTIQGQSVSGACGGTVTVTGDVNDATTPDGVLTAALSCTASLGTGPSEPLSISIDGAEAYGIPGVHVPSVGVDPGLGTYTTS